MDAKFNGGLCTWGSGLSFFPPFPISIITLFHGFDLPFFSPAVCFDELQPQKITILNFIYQDV